LYGRAGRLTALFGGFRPGQRLPGFAAPWEFGPGPLCDYWGSTVFGDGVLSVLPGQPGTDLVLSALLMQNWMPGGVCYLGMTMEFWFLSGLRIGPAPTLWGQPVSG
jgi:hypothetical protein